MSLKPRRSAFFRRVQESLRVHAVDPFSKEMTEAKRRIIDQLAKDVVEIEIATLEKESKLSPAKREVRIRERANDYFDKAFRLLNEKEVSEAIRDLPKTESGKINCAEILDDSSPSVLHEEHFGASFIPDELLADPHGEEETPDQFLTSHFGDESALDLYRECQASPRPETPLRQIPRVSQGAPDPQRNGTVIGTALIY